jgi:PAS domain S-box-containing protein
VSRSRTDPDALTSRDAPSRGYGGGDLLRRAGEVFVAGPGDRELCAWLAAAGLEAHRAPDPGRALARLRRRAAEVLVLPWDDRDGPAICRELREDSRLAGTWILAILPAKASPAAALEGGADDFLQRPFDTPQLVSRTRTALRATRQRAEEELVGALLTNVPGAIYRSAWDRGYALELISDEIERISGYPTSDFVEGAHTLMDIIHPDDLEYVMTQAAQLGDDGNPFVLHYRIVRADGAVRWVVDRGQLVHGPHGRLWMDGVLFDVTEQHEAEEALRRHQVELARMEEVHASRARIVEAGDAARRRIERDLHDGAQQRLVALALDVRIARSRVENDPASAPAALDRIAEELRVASAELRDLARGIHPAVLSEHGLGAALDALASRSPVPVDLAEVPDGRFAPAVEGTAYFTIAEALTNVAKHAQASSVAVRVTTDGGTLTIEVADDGVGFATTAEGSGLTGLSDRVGALGGTLDVTSRPGEGTTVRAEIPARTA